jgi:hypothetical protein
MKPHPRIRRTIKWGGAAATLLLATSWAASAWWYVVFRVGNGIEIAGGRGVLQAAWPMPKVAYALDSGFRAGWVFPRGNLWWMQIDADLGRILIPFWIPLAVAIALTAWAWHLDALACRRERAARLNLCPKCNYDRAGIAKDAVCPECGASGGAKP